MWYMDAYPGVGACPAHLVYSTYIIASFESSQLVYHGQESHYTSHLAVGSIWLVKEEWIAVHLRNEMDKNLSVQACTSWKKCYNNWNFWSPFNTHACLQNQLSINYCTHIIMVQPLINSSWLTPAGCMYTVYVHVHVLLSIYHIQCIVDPVPPT